MTEIHYPTPAPEIFKAYDIRGIVDHTLTQDAVRAIGHALGSEARARNLSAIVIGRDGRLSGPSLAASLADGIRAAGIDVVDIGAAPTPVTYFAAHHLGIGSCVSVTGSHNPPEYNGLKMVLGGQTLHGPLIQALRKRIEEKNLAFGNGTWSQADVAEAYVDRIVSDVRLARPMKVVVDCGNGIAGAIAPQLLSKLGCEQVELFCEVDGTFPNHHPDPSKPENLADVIRALKETDAELGLAFDGDGDRLGVVTRSGNIIYPDRQLMLFAADVLERVPGGQIIYDVKCTRLLDGWIRQHGGEPLMWNTGHALIKGKLAETGAPLAGEMSGHVFFKERWYGFDDGLYTAARLLEILSRHDDPDEVLHALPEAISTPELNIRMNEGEPFELVERLRGSELFRDASHVIELDGVRVEYADGFGLVRASNTTPVAVLRFEADDEAGLTRIQSVFREALRDAWPGIETPF